LYPVEGGFTSMRSASRYAIKATPGVRWSRRVNRLDDSAALSQIEARYQWRF